MNYKVKSILYFASFLLAVVAYYALNQTATMQRNQVANNSIELVVQQDALN